LKILKQAYRKIASTFLITLHKELKDCETILDLGCGKNSPLIHCDYSGYSVGLEVFKLYLRKSKRKKIHREYILGDVRFLGFKNKSFDAVCALDVLEHLTKEEGISLIREMGRISKKKAIIFTPNGFLPQSRCEIEANPYQAHRSGWTPREFKNLGYTVKGINGIRFLRKERAEIRFKPIRVFKALSNITEMFTYNCPSLAFQLLCTKMSINSERRSYQLMRSS